jgi:hypothetical protein
MVTAQPICENSFLPCGTIGCASQKLVGYFPCKHCGSKNVHNKGLRRKYKNVRQFKCKDCGKTFEVKLFCMLPKYITVRKPTVRNPTVRDPTIKHKRQSMKMQEQIRMQEIKDNYINQNVDSLVDLPCFGCPDIIRCDPNECIKLESWLK